MFLPLVVRARSPSFGPCEPGAGGSFNRTLFRAVGVGRADELDSGDGVGEGTMPMSR